MYFEIAKHKSVATLGTTWGKANYPKALNISPSGIILVPNMNITFVLESSKVLITTETIFISIGCKSDKEAVYLAEQMSLYATYDKLTQPEYFV